ncbi:hypothetical protein K505DRAFT_77653, partial [Melanomma pulvis-pyrius CBS 109.77]
MTATTAHSHRGIASQGGPWPADSGRRLGWPQNSATELGHVPHSRTASCRCIEISDRGVQTRPSGKLADRGGRQHRKVRMPRGEGRTWLRFPLRLIADSDLAIMSLGRASTGQRQGLQPFAEGGRRT